MGKINVLVVPSDNQGGVGFFRSTQPHIQLQNQFPDEFNVTFDMKPNFFNLEDFEMFDIIHIHKGLFANEEQFNKAMNYFKEKGIVTIMDIDDYWQLGLHHPQHLTYLHYGIDKRIKGNFSKFDYVTTTTPLFADKIKPFNPNVYVFPNAINPEDERFQVTKEPSNGRLRIGMIMGSTHEYDLLTMGRFTNGLSKDILDKVQFVLCGYDLRGSVKMIDPKTKESRERPLLPKETVWYRYEKQLTDDYRLVNPQYKQFLEMFIPNVSYPNELYEPYRRCWTKDMDHYYQHYKTCDVLFAPLEENDFNYVKSQLKVIECAFSNTAIVASNFGPYTIDLKNAIERGGGINPNGNAILIDKNKAHKDWTKTVERLVKNPVLVKQLQTNLHNDICEEYDLRNVTKKRADFYKEIVNKTKNKK